MSTSPSLPECFDEQAKHPLHDVTRSPEEILLSLGYDPAILKRHDFNTQGIRLWEITPSLTQEQKEYVLRSPLWGDECSESRMQLRLLACRDFEPSAFLEEKLVLLYGRDMSCWSLVSSMTGLPEEVLQISDPIAKKSAFLAYIAVHELAHFEMPEYDLADVTGCLRVETHCDRRAREALGNEAAFAENRMEREIILMRAVQDMNRLPRKMMMPIYQIDGILPSKAKGYLCNFKWFDVAHSTALFLKKGPDAPGFEAAIEEYKGLVPLLAGTLEEALGTPFPINYTHVYKAVRIILDSASADNAGADSPALSSVQREILELYAEGMEHFCPVKCARLRDELAGKLRIMDVRHKPEWDGYGPDM